MYTTLDIINEMVSSTGARTFTAAQPTHPSFIKAEQTLDRVRASVLARGLWFNTEVRTVQQQTDGEVLVPQGCIKADPTSRLCNLTLRGNRMYDLDTGTYEIGEDVELNMFFELRIDEVPLAALEYIRAKGVYDFYLGADGTDPKLSSYRNERDMRWRDLWREHLRNRKANIYDNNSNTINQLRRGNSGGRWQPIVR